MRKIFLLLLLCVWLAPAYAQFTVDTAIVPQYAVGHGKYATINTQRLPFYAWVQLSGLTANATYIYNCLLDSTPNTLTTGAGQSIWIDIAHDTIYTSTSTAFSKSKKSGKFTATATGKYQGWFSVVPDNDARFKAGNKVYIKILTNGGTSTAADTTVAMVTPIKYPIRVLNFLDSSKLNDCSFFYDSTRSPRKSFVFVYDNISGMGRPLAGAVVENDGVKDTTLANGTPLVLNSYKTNVNVKKAYWGTAIPDTLPNGIRRIEFRHFISGSIDSTYPIPTDTQGIWSSGIITSNPTNDTTGIKICALCAPNISMQVYGIDYPDTMFNCNKTSSAVGVFLVNNSSIPFSNFNISYQLNNGTVVTENVGTKFVIQGFYSHSNFGHYLFKSRAALKTSGLIQQIKVWVTIPHDTSPIYDTGAYAFYNLASPVKDTIHAIKDTIKINTVDSFFTGNHAMSYQWTWGDTTKAIDSSNNPTHIYKALGKYKVTLIANGGICGIDTVYHNVVVVKYGSGQQNIKAVSHVVSLYPNPASSDFTISGITKIPNQVSVYNLLGQAMTCNYEWHSGNLVVYTSHLSAGQYFVRIVVAGNTLTRRFTKE